jgi:hypothetical protein
VAIVDLDNDGVAHGEQTRIVGQSIRPVKKNFVNSCV